MLAQVRNLGRAVEDDDDYEKLQRAGEVASTAINANQDCDREELKHIEEDLQTAKKSWQTFAPEIVKAFAAKIWTAVANII